jgi:hypothetical protein
MNTDKKKLRKELLHGRARYVRIPLGLGSSWTRWVRCRRWGVMIDQSDPIRWHDRLAKLANRAAVQR